VMTGIQQVFGACYPTTKFSSSFYRARLACENIKYFADSGGHILRCRVNLHCRP